MTQCISCNHSIEPFISFGKQPLGNGFLSKPQFKSEYFFELEVCFCQSCSLVQLANQPKPEQMFNDAYSFFSGTSTKMAQHFERFADDIASRYLKPHDPFVVELGSNDGIMLQHFAKRKIRHLGFEPSANVAAVAQSKGINTRCSFFNQKHASHAASEFGHADAILAANVMCHIPYLHSVMEGMTALLKPTGIIAFEDPYLGDIVTKISYDQIYDEHVSLFSATSVKNLFEHHGMELIDTIPQPTHGGSMRYVIAPKGTRKVASSVTETLAREVANGLGSLKTFTRFKKSVEQSRADLKQLLNTFRKDHKRVVGYAATSKSTTVINYCSLTPDLIEFISDTTPIKQGKFSPGMHIPVLSYERFKENYPDFALLFGWNHQQEIFEKEKEYRSQGGQWVVYVPRVEIIG